MSLIESEWFTEMWEGQTAFSVRYSEKLFDRVSPFQRIEIFQTEGMGRVLVLGGCFMVTEKDSFIYHEMLVHPAMSVVPQARKVLVIGGGDGGAVTEAMKYPEVESVTLCEIDPMVVESCREYFPEISAGLSDPRARSSMMTAQRMWPGSRRNLTWFWWIQRTRWAPAQRFLKGPFMKL